MAQSRHSNSLPQHSLPIIRYGVITLIVIRKNVIHEFIKKYFPKLKCPYCHFEFSILSSTACDPDLGFPCGQCESDLISKSANSKSGIRNYILRFLRTIMGVIGGIIVGPNIVGIIYNSNIYNWLYFLIGTAIILMVISTELRSKKLIIASYSR